MILLMWNLKYDTNGHIYETEKDQQTQKTRAMVTKGSRGQQRDKLGVWGQQTQTTIYKIDKQQSPTYSTGKYFQYPVINNNEKIYMCIYLCVYIHIYMYKLNLYSRNKHNSVNQLYFNRKWRQEFPIGLPPPMPSLAVIPPLQQRSRYNC